MPTFETLLGEYTRHLEKERNLSEHTIRAYVGDLESFLNHLEMQKLDDVSALTIAHIRSWLASQQVKGEREQPCLVGLSLFASSPSGRLRRVIFLKM